MAREFYKSAEDERLDKAQQQGMFDALDAVSTAFRLKDFAWTITGRFGKIFTWGDKARSKWAIYCCPSSTVNPEGSARAWGAAKKKLLFLKTTQDGDFDGVFFMDHLPDENEAAAIREVIGIRRRPNVSEASLAALRSALEARQTV